jgi:hypothetical protein
MNVFVTPAKDKPCATQHFHYDPATLTISFKKPFDSLAKTTVAAQRAASESERNSVWWCFLNLNRTVLEENPPD